MTDGLSTMTVRVTKLGGSLLLSPRVGERFMRWISLEPPALSLVVVGGGPLVDAVRELATLHNYEEQFLHWLCVDLMQASHRLFAAQVPDCTLINHKAELQEAVDRYAQQKARCVALVNVSAFYSRESEAELPLRLPCSWETTSDSLAALLAHLTTADELVLLKSCEVRNSHSAVTVDWEQLAKQGIVDRAFPASIRGLKQVRCSALPG